MKLLAVASLVTLVIVTSLAIATVEVKAFKTCAIRNSYAHQTCRCDINGRTIKD